MFKEMVLAVSAARTVSGSSDVVDTLAGNVDGPSAPDARFALNVTAASGTNPNLAMKLVGVVNGVDYDLTPAFAAKTAAGKETIVVTKCPRYVKAVWTITGTTPSLTFEVAGER